MTGSRQAGDERQVLAGVMVWCRRHWPWLTVAVGPWILLGPTLLSGRVLFWGTPLLQFVPWHEFALRSLRAGYLALWNPLVGMGAPLLANYQSALLYPPNWLLAIVGVPWGEGLLVALHLAWAGLGMAVLGRRLGMSRLSQAITGVSFGLSGFLVARSGFFSINATVAWLPWVIVGVDKLASAPSGWFRPVDRWAYPAAIGAFSLQWLAGHAQLAWYSLILAIVWTAWRSAASNGRQAVAKAFARLGLVLAVSFLIDSPQLLPTLEYLRDSQRAASVGRELALTYSFWPWRFLGLVAPGLFGSPVQGDFWGYGNFWEDAIYVGVLPFLLAVGAGWRGLRGREPKHGLVRLLLGLSAVSIVLALGKNTPIFVFLFDHVPTFALFQAPTRWTLWLVFALSLLAGFGAEAWKPAAGWGLYWMRLGTAGAAMIGVAAWLGRGWVPGVAPSFVRSLVLLSGVLFLSGVVGLTRKDQPGVWWKAAVILLVLADLLVADRGLNPSTQPSLYRPARLFAAQVQGGERIYMTPDVEYAYKFFRAFRFDSFQPSFDWAEVRKVGLPNTAMLDGIQSASNFDPLVPARYSQWMGSLANLDPGRRDVLLGLMDVGLVADRKTSGDLPAYSAVPGAARARVVYQARWVRTPSEALDQLMLGEVDPQTTVVFEGPHEVTPVASRGTSSVSWAANPNPNGAVLNVSSSTAGWLVISQIYYPGWRATIDGIPVPLLRADYLFAGLALPAGEHVVKLEYRPVSFYAGLVLCLLGLVGLGLVTRWSRRS